MIHSRLAKEFHRSAIQPGISNVTLMMFCLRNLVTRWVLLILVLSDVSAATNLGLWVIGKRPYLDLGFGNPTDYPTSNPGIAYLDLGPDSTYFGGSASAERVETSPEYIPGASFYGGPGDSWSQFTLTSPTPGSTAVTPIIYRFHSHIINKNSALGYSVASRLDNAWYFSPAGAKIYFRVDWTMRFVGLPYTEKHCRFDPVTFNLVCSEDLMGSTGWVSAGFWIEGYESTTFYSEVTGPGAVSKSGSINGVANATFMNMAMSTGYYVGQGSRGDCEVTIELKVYADTEPLPPVLSVAPPAPEGLRLSWPAESEGYVLQVSSSIDGPDWKEVPVEAHDFLAEPDVSAAKFYRLAKP